jgi:hypothetical protein
MVYCNFVSACQSFRRKFGFSIKNREKFELEMKEEAKHRVERKVEQEVPLESQLSSSKPQGAKQEHQNFNRSALLVPKL